MQCTKSSYVSTSTSSFSSWSARVSVLNVAKKTHPGAAGIEFPNNSPKSGFHSNCAHIRIHACRIITHFNLCWRLRWETLTKKISFPCKLLSVTGNGLGLFSKAAFSEHLCITITCCVAKIIWRKGKALVAGWDFAHLKKKKNKKQKWWVDRKCPLCSLFFVKSTRFLGVLCLQQTVKDKQLGSGRNMFTCRLIRLCWERLDVKEIVPVLLERTQNPMWTCTALCNISDLYLSFDTLRECIN